MGNVIDEGKGMSPERLEKVIAEMNDYAFAGSRQGGIGLANVFQRLQLFFGQSAELYIESHEEVGTIVSFHFPIHPHNKGKFNYANSNR